MLFKVLVDRAKQFSSRSLTALPNKERWLAKLPEKRDQWWAMLGLDDQERDSDLCATVTGTLERKKYVIEKLHYQPVPGARVAANLYLPRNQTSPLPAIVYVCGHSDRGKFHYQPHARWFAEHGYVCMILDASWAGECGGFHHGVYNNQWWHWYSQGYSPAGFEVWAAIRALDYLETRKEVDSKRFGITGNSGGGGISWFTGAADERLKVVAPSCQTGTMYQHIKDRTLDSHCDCTYWCNTQRWDLSDVAALIAPRALLVAAQAEDIHFRRYGYRQVVDGARKVYELLSQADKVDLVEDTGQHGYNPKTRLAIFNWFEKHLKNSSKEVTEDIQTWEEADEDLAVYNDRKPPIDDQMKDVHRFFVKPGDQPEVNSQADWVSYQHKTIAKLKATTFAATGDNHNLTHVEIRPQGAHEQYQFKSFHFESEPGLEIQAHLSQPTTMPQPWPLIVGPLGPDQRTGFATRCEGLNATDSNRTAVATIEVRGTGCTAIGEGLQWTMRRSYPLLGQTLPERQVHDLLVGLQVLRDHSMLEKVALYGRGEQACLSIYAAMLDENVSCLVLEQPVLTHCNSNLEFLSILKIGDAAQNLALLYPRPIVFVKQIPEECNWLKNVYDKCSAGEQIKVVDEVSQWVEATGL